MNLNKVGTIGSIKVPKTKPFGKKGSTSRWKREGSPQAMLKLKKVKY